MSDTAKFKVGQVVMWQSRKRKFPILVLEIIETKAEGLPGEFSYRIDRTNWLAEHMLRPLTKEEAGHSGSVQLLDDHDNVLAEGTCTK